jgi:hypothetical protein
VVPQDSVDERDSELILDVVHQVVLEVLRIGIVAEPKRHHDIRDALELWKLGRIGVTPILQCLDSGALEIETNDHCEQLARHPSGSA